MHALRNNFTAFVMLLHLSSVRELQLINGVKWWAVMWAGRAKKIRCCLLDLPFDPEDSGKTDLRNVDELIPD